MTKKQEAILAAIKKAVEPTGQANLAQVAFDGSWMTREVAYVARRNGYLLEVKHGRLGVTARHTLIRMGGARNAVIKQA